MITPTPEPNPAFRLVARTQNVRVGGVRMKQLPVQPKVMDMLFGLSAVLLILACAMNLL
jgi:hypothetical protein